MSADPGRNPAPNSIRVGNAELATARQVMRELPQLIDRLDAGDVEKLVITQANQMRVVITTLQRWAELDARYRDLTAEDRTAASIRPPPASALRSDADGPRSHVSECPFSDVMGFLQQRNQIGR